MGASQMKGGASGATGCLRGLSVCSSLFYFGERGKEAHRTLWDRDLRLRAGLLTFLRGAGFSCSQPPKKGKKMTTAKASLLRTLMMLAAAALAASLLILIAAGEPLQAAPGDKGKIAFASDRAGNMDIWLMNPDGTNPVQLTNDPLPEVFPAFSPDGNKIAFVRGERAGAEIYVMNANGTGQTQLTSNGMGDAQPTWSPDG